MRGKVAKRLRRQAEAETVGQAWSKLGWSKGQSLYKGTVFRRELHPDCGKKLYKALKRAYKRGATLGRSG